MAYCGDCGNCKIYRSNNYYEPDDATCLMESKIDEETFSEAWTEGHAEVCPYFRERWDEEF